MPSLTPALSTCCCTGPVISMNCACCEVWTVNSFMIELVMAAKLRVLDVAAAGRARGHVEVQIRDYFLAGHALDDDEAGKLLARGTRPEPGHVEAHRDARRRHPQAFADFVACEFKDEF